jgi:7-keto-8-aminopelargonate synthetase-like enzyme
MLLIANSLNNNIMRTGNIMIGAVKSGPIARRQELDRLNKRLQNYFKQFVRLEKIYDRTEDFADLRKIEALQDKISIVTGKLERLETWY